LALRAARGFFVVVLLDAALAIGSESRYW